MANNMDPPLSSEEEEYDDLKEGQDVQDEEEKGEEEDEGEKEEEDQDEEVGEEDDEEDHGCRAVVLFPPNKPKNEVKDFYKAAFDAEDIQEHSNYAGHFLSFYVPGFSFYNDDSHHDISRILFDVKDENDNDKLYYESLEARSKRGFHSWSSLTH